MKIDFDTNDLKPLIEATVAETLLRLRETGQPLGSPEQIAYTEEQAAALLGMRRHCLRDERLRGRIVGSITSGRKIRYTRAELERYLNERRDESRVTSD